MNTKRQADADEAVDTYMGTALGLYDAKQRALWAGQERALRLVLDMAYRWGVVDALDAASSSDTRRRKLYRALCPPQESGDSTPPW